MAEEMLTERIKNAGRYLGVSRRELEDEFVQLYHAQDKQGAMELFMAYQNWEIRESKGRKSLSEIKDLARQNLDYVCEVADTRIRRREGHETDAAVVEATIMSTPVVGEVRQFYRDSTNYHPIDPRLN